MQDFKFDPTQSKMIVEAIIDGYRDYVAHRKDRKENMIISSAFAWTKGNFIESKVAEESGSHGFIYKKSKAGLTWDYLQFIHGDSKILFLIKNAAYFNEKSFSQARLPVVEKSSKELRTYLHELSKINAHLPFPKQMFSDKESGFENAEQLAFWMTDNQAKKDLDGFKSSFTEFHILTYRIDEAFQISEVKHFLPNPDTNQAELIEDLSDYIAGADLTEEEREVIAPEMNDDTFDPTEFDIGILEDEKQNE